MTSRKKSSKKKKDKRDRWARTEEAYTHPGENQTAHKRKKSKKRRSTIVDDNVSRQSDSTAID